MAYQIVKGQSSVVILYQADVYDIVSRAERQLGYAKT
jgi:hypothetical protein